MPYRISKSDIENIADVLPDAYVLDDNGKTVELVLQGSVDPKTAASIAVVVDEEKIDEYRKEKRQQLIEEVREVQSYTRCDIKKRVLCAIINNAVNNGLHS